MMNLNRKWGLKLSQQHSRSSLAVHLTMRLFGRLTQCETIKDMNETVHTATLVFCYRYNTLELKKHLAKLEKSINTFKPSSLLNDISDGKKEYPSVEDDSDHMLPIEDSGSAKSETTKATNVKENSEILYQIKGSKFQKYWDKKISICNSKARVKRLVSQETSTFSPNTLNTSVNFIYLYAYCGVKLCSLKWSIPSVPIDS